MKQILLTLFYGILLFSASAQEKKSGNVPERVRVIADRDTIEVKVNNENKKIEILFEMGVESIDHNLKKDTLVKKKESRQYIPSGEVKYSKVFGGVTFSYFDLGLAMMLDNGKTALSQENKFLKYRGLKSVNVGFDVLKIGYRFDDKFRILLSTGFDWTHFRLKNDIIIKEGTSPLDYEDSSIHYSKNRFSSTYLRIPLTFEYRPKAGGISSRFRYAFGPIGGILIRGSQKFKSKEEGKRKNIDDFNYAPFRYGAFVRVNFIGIGVYAKYYFNDMFENSPAQEGLRNLNVGLNFAF